MAVVEQPAGLTRRSVEELSASKAEPDWMRRRRLTAWEQFDALPLPTRQDEEWRRTDISKLKLAELAPYTPAGGQPVESPLQLNGNNGGLLRHENSQTVDRSLSEEAAASGVIFTDLETAVRDHSQLVEQHFMTEAVPSGKDKFTALNGALWSGGTFLYVPKDVTVEVPLRTLYTLTAAGVALFTHTLVVLETGARATFIEEYASAGIAGQALNAGVVELFLRPGAHLTFITLQDWQGGVYDISTERALLDKDSKLDWLVIGLGDGTTKSNIETALRGAGATTQMLGVLWGYGKQHTDYHTVQDHLAPHTTSDLLYKGALTDEARSVFSGRIRVVKGANGTDAYQANRNVLLSDKAASFPSPNLEIEANEVRCTHGASVGKIDQDQLFYLMSRGLSKDIATRMVVEGFFSEVLEREPVGSIRQNLRDLISRKMDLA